MTSSLNRRDRLAEILGRDRGRCVWCGRTIGTDLVRATTEHVVPKVKRGPSWLENEVAAIAERGGQRRARRYVDSQLRRLRHR